MSEDAHRIPGDTSGLWLVMDARHATDPDNATCLFTADTKKEAEEYAKDYPGSVVIQG